MKKDISSDLQTYMMEISSTPWIWGDNDCCSLAADWCVARGYDDPMERWRGKYDCEVGARGFINEYGGLPSLWLIGMADAGIEETSNPEIGDIGIAEVNGDHGPELVGAIYAGRRWHMRSPLGIYSARVEPILCWRVN